MILDAIIKNKKKEIEALKKRKPLPVLKKEVLHLKKKTSCFIRALQKGHEVSVIAEIKRKSPSRGLLRAEFDPVKLAKSYRDAGARALSVLTDKKFFGGSLMDLKKVRSAVRLPILRKDFTIHEYQIYESRLAGADAILLIAAVLTSKKIGDFQRLAQKLGMDVLVEIHTQAELKKVLPFKPKLIGINNRNLNSFAVDIRATEELVKKVPKGSLVVSESGIQKHSQIRFLQSLGVRSVLVGESLMNKKDVKQALLELRGVSRGKG